MSQTPPADALPGSEVAQQNAERDQLISHHYQSLVATSQIPYISGELHTYGEKLRKMVVFNLLERLANDHIEDVLADSEAREEEAARKADEGKPPPPEPESPKPLEAGQTPPPGV